MIVTYGQTKTNAIFVKMNLKFEETKYPHYFGMTIFLLESGVMMMVLSNIVYLGGVC